MKFVTISLQAEIVYPQHIIMISAEFAQDRLYPSDNEYEIPCLRLDRQPKNGLLLPFSGLGTNARIKTNIATYHFYVDDYRFQNIWLHPERLVKSGCQEVIEPNFSLFQTTPIAYGMQLLYKKRWIARWLQECGIRVWVDLNVAPKFREVNMMGVPHGYNAFVTRGHAGELCQIEAEFKVAKEISGMQIPNLLVYGGGKDVQEYCRHLGVLYLYDYQTDRRRRIRKEDLNG
ncbi:MAG: DUF4417 domain-containing protein [Muribaculaceae bacterium]|nr:DUF4417 domain-containing protein [Muribaculaceae bacterium]